MIRHLIIAAALAAAPASAQVIATDWKANAYVKGVPPMGEQSADNAVDIRKVATNLCAVMPDALKLKCLVEVGKRSFRSLTADGPSYHPYIIPLEHNLAGGLDTYIAIYGQPKAP